MLEAAIQEILLDSLGGGHVSICGIVGINLHRVLTRKGPVLKAKAAVKPVVNKRLRSIRVVP